MRRCAILCYAVIRAECGGLAVGLLGGRLGMPARGRSCPRQKAHSSHLFHEDTHSRADHFSSTARLRHEAIKK